MQFCKIVLPLVASLVFNACGRGGGTGIGDKVDKDDDGIVDIKIMSR